MLWVAVKGVPDWFIHYFPIPLITAESEISSNWIRRGVVYVTINNSFAYKKLYEQAKTTCFYSLIAFIVSMLLLAMLLRITLTSLNRINQLAIQITGGHFGTIKNPINKTKIETIVAPIIKGLKNLLNEIPELNMAIISVSLANLEVNQITDKNRNIGNNKLVK